MNSDKTLDFLHQVFSRFFISGIVFYLFTIWLPITLYFRLDHYNFFVSNPMSIILSSLSIGLLLDLSKFYRLSWRILSINKENLENLIVESFGISINKENRNSNYKGRIAESARQIHEIYIRTYHQASYQRIKDARIYPDILAMTFLSILLFIIIEFIILTTYFISTYYSHLRLLDVVKNFPFSSTYTLIMIGLNITLIFVLFIGRKKVRHVYRLVTDFTKSIIEDAYYTTPDEIKRRFLQSLLTSNLVTFDKKNGLFEVDPIVKTKIRVIFVTV